MMRNHPARSLAIAVILLLTLVASSTSAAEAGNRRATGPDGTLYFGRSVRVAGEVIALKGGKHFYRCRWGKTPRRGKVTSGVIRPIWAEIKHLRQCRKTLASPGPRRQSGDGRWRSFKRGDHVLGFAIEVNSGFAGRTYFDCAVIRADAGGRVLSGVVNPTRFEIRSMTPCNRTTNWRPGFRTETGSGSLFFRTGDWIVGDKIRFDNGRVEHGCWMKNAPTTGVVVRGVRNPWPGDIRGKRRC